MQALKFKYTTSKGRDSYGYNICSLWVDGEKRGEELTYAGIPAK